MLNEKNFREAFEPLHASEQTVKEVLNMTRKEETRSPRWVLRTAMVAALVICLMMTMTVAMAGGNDPGDLEVDIKPFQPGVFETEEELLNAIFGLNGTYDLVEEYLVTYEGEYPKTEQYPGWERAAMDSEVAAEVAPLVIYIGKSMEWNGYTFTADHLVYDKITGVGALVYTMEFARGMPEFESYYSNGSFINEYIMINNVGSPHMIVPGKTTDELLVGYYTFFYEDPPKTITVTFGRNAEMGLSSKEEQAERQKIINQYSDGIVVEEDDPWWAPLTVYGPKIAEWEDSFPQSDCSVVIDLVNPQKSECLTIRTNEGDILMTPMGMTAYFAGADEATNGSVAIRYADGTEYLVYNHPDWQPGVLYGHQQNFHEGCLNTEIGYAFMFNRLVDLDEVVCVVLNGTEYFVE